MAKRWTILAFQGSTIVFFLVSDWGDQIVLMKVPFQLGIARFQLHKVSKAFWVLCLVPYWGDQLILMRVPFQPRVVQCQLPMAPKALPSVFPCSLTRWSTNFNKITWSDIQCFFTLSKANYLIFHCLLHIINCMEEVLVV